MLKPDTATSYFLLLAVLVGFTTACNRKDHTAPAENATAKQSAASPATARPQKTISELTVREIKLIRDQDGKLFAKGEVANTATRPLTKVEATLKIYDDKNVEIATLKPTVDQLQPLYSWNFIIPVPQSNATKATIVEFTEE